MRSLRRRSSDRPAASRLNWDQYAARWAALHGGLDPRQARPSVERWLRFGYRTALGCARLRIRPTTVTTFGLLLGLGAVPLLALRGGWWTLLAAVVVVIASVADMVDGAVAVLTSETTRLGYVYDAVSDRLTEFGWLLAFWLIGVPGYLVVAAGALSWLHEYTRSRSNAAGMVEIGATTLGERPTRAILTVIGLGLAGLAGLANADLAIGVATFAVAAWTILAVIGFAQLFGTVHRALSGRPWVAPVRPPASAPPISAPPAPAGRPDSIEPLYAVDDEFDAVDLETIGRMMGSPASSAVYTSHAADDAAAADAAFDMLPNSGPKHSVD